MTHIFIVNPFAGRKTFADDLRTKLANIKGLNYFVFNTRYAGNETELVAKIQHIFEGEKLRFYCCGGSGTMRNMLDGFEDLDNAEVVFFPCGLTNDYLKVFGSNEKLFHQIENLITGDVIDVDYIQTNHGVALNTFTTGLDTTNNILFEKYRMFSIFNEQMPYNLSLLCSLFIVPPAEYEIYIDNDLIEGSFSEIFFGNGHVLGGNLFFQENTNAADGLALGCLFPGRRGLRLMSTLTKLQHQKYDDLKSLATYFESRKIRILRKDRTPFSMNLDGESMPADSEWSARIVKKGLHFVVPKGVKV